MRGRTVFAEAAALAIASCVVAGCATQQTPSPPASTASPAPSSTVIRTTPAACMDALLIGRLVADPARGVAVVRDVDGRRVEVRWPPGYRATNGDRVQLLDGNGRPVATVGDRVRIGGGYTTELQWEACADAIEASPD